MQLVSSITLAKHWLPALFNSDCSGLSDEEQQQFDEFFEKYYGVGVYTYDYESDESSDNFMIDEISGLYADCVEIDVYDNLL